MASMNSNAGTQTSLPVHLATVAQNSSPHDGCIMVTFSDMENVTRESPHDMIVGAQVEEISRRLKDTILVFLFLVGGPGNIINLMVFYKQGLKDRVNLCLFALALADELYLITGMFYHAEQLHVQFTTGERFGPMMIFMINNNFTGFLSFNYVSLVLSAVIASERCYCVLSPLNYQTLMRTRTMAAIILATYVLVVGLFFIVAFRYRIGCVYDPNSGEVVKIFIMGGFYKVHKQFIDVLESVVFGAGLQGLVTVVVMTTTFITTMKLRHVVTWRSGTSSLISSREVALIKMLVGNSIFFISCIFPVTLTHIIWLSFPKTKSETSTQNFYLTTVWISQLFTFINSTFNIFVYYIMGSRFRETFWALFGKKTKPEKSVKDTVPIVCNGKNGA